MTGMYNEGASKENLKLEFGTELFLVSAWGAANVKLLSVKISFMN
jgi:hypothetical protein